MLDSTDIQYEHSECYQREEKIKIKKIVSEDKRKEENDKSEKKTQNRMCEKPKSEEKNVQETKTVKIREKKMKKNQ